MTSEALARQAGEKHLLCESDLNNEFKGATAVKHLPQASHHIILTEFSHPPF